MKAVKKSRLFSKVGPANEQSAVALAGHGAGAEC